MANLVPVVNALTPQVERTIDFRGLNRKPVFQDGEMSDMLNLTGDGYPQITHRAKRAKFRLNHIKEPVEDSLVDREIVEIYSIITRFERVAMIAKITDQNRIVFIYQDIVVSDVTGLTPDTKMVAINTKICFFTKAHYVGETLVPMQKTCIEIVRNGSEVTLGDFYELEAAVPSVQTTVDIATDDFGQTITFPTGTDISGFRVDDSINIVGTLTPTGGSPIDVVISCLIDDINGQVISVPQQTFIELTQEGTATGTLVIDVGGMNRPCPDMDVATIIEHNNRLWGASSVDNTIYACKLGDPTNWQYYQTTSMDSFYAQQGTDGDYTGAAAYSQHIVFFKQETMAKVYGSAPSSFQVQNAKCYGLMPGEEKSVTILNDIVFYRSSIGLMAYEGGSPYAVTDKFYCNISNVVCGTEGRKLYCSFHNDDADINELMVCDIDKALWHKEDAMHFRSTCTLEGRLYFVNDADGTLWVTNPTAEDIESEVVTLEETFDWSATFGPFDEYIENRKIYSKLSLRLNVYTGTTISVWIKLNDGNGDTETDGWELVKEYTAAQTGGEFIPIVPRRCDRYSIRIDGHGDCEIKSLTRRYRVGTGGKL